MLFSPLRIKQMELPNRIVFPPMANNMADTKGHVTTRLITHYVERCRQVGLLIVEHTYVNPAGRINPHQLGIYDDECTGGLTRLADSIHAAGANCGIQLTHAGACAPPELAGQEPVGPSPVTHPRDGGMPREITEPEMDRLVEDFAAAAARAKAAGFDMVEIHGAHGYLLNQFISPYTNRRTDSYGGSLENRLKFPLRVVRAVRQAIGENLQLFFRLGADDGFGGGLTLDEGAKAAQLLTKEGVDVLDLSGGLLGFRIKSGEGFFVYLAERIKPLVNVPVLVTGGITTPELADKILSEGKADLIGVGRALLANPNWAADANALVLQKT